MTTLYESATIRDICSNRRWFLSKMMSSWLDLWYSYTFLFSTGTSTRSSSPKKKFNPSAYHLKWSNPTVWEYLEKHWKNLYKLQEESSYVYWEYRRVKVYVVFFRRTTQTLHFLLLFLSVILSLHCISNITPDWALYIHIQSVDRI